MLDVASLEKFDFWNGFHLISGAWCLPQYFNVVILDYEGIEGDFMASMRRLRHHESAFAKDPEKIYPLSSPSSKKASRFRHQNRVLFRIFLTKSWL